MLTRCQKDLLGFIREFVAANGYGPSFEEMKRATGVSSKSGIDRLVSALEERGFITRARYLARSIKIVDLEIERVRKASYDQGYRDAMAELGHRLVGSAA